MMIVTVKLNLCDITCIQLKIVADSAKSSLSDVIYFGRKLQATFNGPPRCDFVFGDPPIEAQKSLMTSQNIFRPPTLH